MLVFLSVGPVGHPTSKFVYDATPASGRNGSAPDSLNNLPSAGHGIAKEITFG